MKGKILKTEDGWVVEVQSDIHAAGFGWLPPVTYHLIVEDKKDIWIGREVEVEICEFDPKSLIPIAVKLKAEPVVGLYDEIEAAIIYWNNDGTRTAGSLTREIMEIIAINQDRPKD